MPEGVTSRSVCPYCGVGCGVVAQAVADGFSITGDKGHPANGGRLCVKGSALAETLGSETRLSSPRLFGESVSWSTALDHVAKQLRSARDAHGPDAIAMYLSGQLLTEDYYVANKLMKGFLGSANVDTNSRLCMASAVVGYKRAFGEDVVPCNYSDLDDCDLLLFIGSNAAWTHPVLYQRAVASKERNPRKRFVVIDVRRTSTCDGADQVLIIRPGSDGFLLGGLLRFLAERGYVNDPWVGQHVSGLHEALSAVSGLDLPTVANATGLPESELLAFYRLFAATENVVSFYSQGINQSATGSDKCNAIINCHLLTGRIGRPGMGPFSITGQPNAMGGREVGGLANQLASHMAFEDASIDRVARFWSATDMATKAGYKAVELFERAAEGEIKFLWIMATNPLVSLPNSSVVKRAFERTEFVVVSDCTDRSETAAAAHALLPAQPWSEKDGTVTNSERVISRQRAFKLSLGQAKADWKIVSEVARRLGVGDEFAYTNAADIFREHAALSGFENTGQRLFDIGALAELDDAAYDSMEPVQWPLDGSDARRPFADGRYSTEDGRARMLALDHRLPQSEHAPAPKGSASLVLTLNTGRLRDQWHTMTRTGLSPRLSKHRDFLTLWINPDDIKAAGLSTGEPVRASNRRGSFVALLAGDESIQRGGSFLPIHWSAPFTGNGKASEVVAPVTDPYSGQPESKFARIVLEPQAIESWAWVVSRGPFDALRNSSKLSYWSSIAVAGGWLTLVASHEEGEGLLELLTDDMQGRDLASYVDAKGREFRAVAEDETGICCAVYVSPSRDQLPNQGSIAGIFDSSNCSTKDNGNDRDVIGLLSGQSSTAADVGALVCSCHEVSEEAIGEAIRAGAVSVEDLGMKLKCGTECGSCIPELKAILRAIVTDAAA